MGVYDGLWAFISERRLLAGRTNKLRGDLTGVSGQFIFGAAAAAVLASALIDWPGATRRDAGKRIDALGKERSLPVLSVLHDRAAGSERADADAELFA